MSKRHIQRLCQRIWDIECVGGHDTDEHVEAVLEGLKKMANRIHPTEAKVIIKFLDSILK